MSKYISCKLVEAIPAVRFRNGDISELPLAHKDRGRWCEKGYKIIYKDKEDKYESWITENVFKETCIEVDDNGKLPSGVSIGSDMVNSFIKNYEVIELNGKTTIVHATLKNGFTITESSSCVDPVNYSKEIGVKICMEKITDKIWELLGFLLQTAYKGVNN